MNTQIRSILAGAAVAAFIASSAHAGTIYAGPTGAMPTDQSFSVNFTSGTSTTAALSFVIDGYLSLDGQNYYEDDFSLKLNNTRNCPGSGFSLRQTKGTGQFGGVLGQGFDDGPALLLGG